MTKRAKGKFKRRKQDFYATPESAVLPLLPHLPVGTKFNEPCAGNGALTLTLQSHGFECGWQSDIEPQAHGIQRCDALSVAACCEDMFITNPPWTREILHSLIVHLSDIAPTWLMFDADWMHTKQAIPYLTRCVKIVSVGRVSWMGNGVSGFDNCAWYLFAASWHQEIKQRITGSDRGVRFYGRMDNEPQKRGP